jgi:antitoxin component YwqK of YwqJK toxin-antitoxin module
MSPIDQPAPTIESKTPVEQFDASGRLIHSASLHEGVLHGEFSSFGVQGVALVNALYIKGQLSGPFTLRDESGRLLQESFYNNGMQDGVTRAYAAGRLLTEQGYVDGKLHGTSIAYAAAGDVCLKQTYSSGQLEGESTTYYEGNLVRKAFYRSGLQHGEALEFSRSGQLMQKATYKDDLLDGTVTRYWPDGTVLESQTYKAGKPVSLLQRFDQNGNLVSDEKEKPSLMQRLEHLVKG